MNNIKFHYLYRDGSNFKKWAATVFSNESGLTIDVITQKICTYFLPDGIFIAHRLRVPEVFLTADYSLSSDDHCYHEFNLVEVTSEDSTDMYGRSIGDFILEIEQEANSGWQAYDLQDMIQRRCI